ncbi:Ger(x)C family spore germination protein [Peribacillus frigoritolerans]|uniref:Ger(x)C family spore germination protein n=1 Tax=Peribacillus frigoritolerans TaxID=450367 RepID=UPI00207AF7C8|nr:Ger(x)C family spore germination protein [Peribacillus frigoritolerans]USK64945.1 Ger(x)C family spore germination protein [Peribacillus frigoritolerans]
MKKNKILLLFLIIPLLIGCWDERLLKNARIVYLTGIDLDEEEKYVTTSIIRNMNISESSRGETSVSNELVTGKGETIVETSINISESVAGNLDPAKGKVLILGGEVAKGDIYNVLDPIYRDPRVDVTAKIAITDGSANELIQHLSQAEMEKGEYLYEMIRSSEMLTKVPKNTLQSVCTYLFDEGKDFFIPYLGIDNEDNKVKVKGTALFNDRSFTGQFLSPEESTLLLLFMEVQSKKAFLTNYIDQSSAVSISYNVKSISQDINVEKKDKVHVGISIQLDVDIVDYPPDNLDNQETISYLNQQLSSVLTEKANVLFKKLADNQSDVLGLGRELIAFHPSIWEEIKGENYYEHIVVNPEVKVNVVSSGITL